MFTTEVIIEIIFWSVIEATKKVAGTSITLVQANMLATAVFYSNLAAAFCLGTMLLKAVFPQAHTHAENTWAFGAS